MSAIQKLGSIVNNYKEIKGHSNWLHDSVVDRPNWIYQSQFFSIPNSNSIISINNSSRTSCERLLLKGHYLIRMDLFVQKKVDSFLPDSRYDNQPISKSLAIVHGLVAIVYECVRPFFISFSAFYLERDINQLENIESPSGSSLSAKRDIAIRVLLSFKRYHHVFYLMQCALSLGHIALFVWALSYQSLFLTAAAVSYSLSILLRGLSYSQYYQCVQLAKKKLAHLLEERGELAIESVAVTREADLNPSNRANFFVDSTSFNFLASVSQNRSRLFSAMNQNALNLSSEDLTTILFAIDRGLHQSILMSGQWSSLPQPYRGAIERLSNERSDIERIIQ